MFILLSLLLSIAALLFAVRAWIDTRALLGIENATNLRSLLKQHHIRQSELREVMQTINENQAGLHGKIGTSFRRSGFVRFNPYRDTGGDQSFCLALLDDKKNGYILTAVHGREGTRVYAKNIVRGKSEYKLSQEEATALKQAIHTK